MVKNIGCIYRELCDDYNNEKYQKSPFLNPDYKKLCDSNSSFEKGICPFYDVIEAIFQVFNTPLDDSLNNIEDIIGKNK